MQQQHNNQNLTKSNQFTQCRACNKHINNNNNENIIRYCCLSCTEKFERCPVCGKYFVISGENHHNSLKCLINFSIAKNGAPFIKQTSLKIFIIANPLYNGELVSKQIAASLKLPFFMSEQIRIENALSLPDIKNYIDENIKKEKGREYFLYLDNSYSYDLLEEFHKSFSFDKYIIIGKEKTDQYQEDFNTTQVKLCTKCGNLNCFFELNKTEKKFLNTEPLKCLICDNQFFRTSVEGPTIKQKLKNYESCCNHILDRFSDKCVNFDFILSSKKTSQEILNNIIYES